MNRNRNNTLKSLTVYNENCNQFHSNQIKDTNKKFNNLKCRRIG